MTGTEEAGDPGSCRRPSKGPEDRGKPRDLGEIPVSESLLKKALGMRQACWTSGGIIFASGHWRGGGGEVCIRIQTKGQGLRTPPLVLI